MGADWKNGSRGNRLPTNFQIETRDHVHILHITSSDGTNRLTQAFILSLHGALSNLRQTQKPIIVTGNENYFSVGADLQEIAALTAPAAYEFSKIGQRLMTAISQFPAPVYAAISGFCMGGGLDLALACHRRIAFPNAIFGHRGAALGLMTGWGGTQRLPRLIGKALALQAFSAAEKIDAMEASRIGLIDGVAHDPVSEAIFRIQNTSLRPSPLLL